MAANLSFDQCYSFAQHRDATHLLNLDIMRETMLKENTASLAASEFTAILSDDVTTWL